MEKLAEPLTLSAETIAKTLVISDLIKAAEAARSSPHFSFVDVPQLGGRVGLRRLSQGDVDDMLELGRRLTKAEKRRAQPRKVLFRWLLLVRTLVDATGERLLADEDVFATWLNDLPSSAVMTMFTTSARLNGFDQKEAEDAIDDVGDEPSADEPSAPALAPPSEAQG